MQPLWREATDRGCERAEMNRVSGREGIPCLAGPRYAMAPAMDHDAVRTFSIYETLEQMRQRAGKRHGAQQPVGMAYKCSLTRSRTRVEPEQHRATEHDFFIR